MVLPALSAPIGLALLALITIALVQPERFKIAGQALTPFSAGFSSLIQAPFEPIGKLGSELGEFGAGFKTAGTGIGAGLSGVFAPLVNLVNWGLTITGKAPAGAPPIYTTVPTTPIYTDPIGDWADLPNTQFLENVLLKSGWKKNKG